MHRGALYLTLSAESLGAIASGRQQMTLGTRSFRGYCPLTLDQLLSAFSSHGVEALIDIAGEFTATFQSEDECLILTSPYGACQHYYTVQRGQFFHADTVLGVLKQANLSWAWNWRALADVAQYDHTLASDTLHPEVSRVPAASVVHFVNGKLEVRTIPWSRLHRQRSTSPQIALAALHEGLRAIGCFAPASPVVSMSGGYDSRVILAALLAHETRPHLLTMGFEDSTDVVIARQIARRLGLQQSIVSLGIEDYLAAADFVAAATNGTKLASHWHTYIYPRKAGLSPDEILIVGTNGEFARSFYADYGWLASTADLTGPLALATYWLRKQRSVFREAELRWFARGFVDAYGQRSRLRRALRMARLCHYQLLAGLDRFYLEHRVRHFMGNGVRLYQESCSWRSPFLVRAWVEAVWSLERRWKQHSRWHRFALDADQPNLLEFPISKDVKPNIGYARYSEWFRDKRITEFLLDQADVLGTLIEPRGVEAIVREHNRSANRTDAVAFLITMAAWMGNVIRTDVSHAARPATLVQL
jgi:asparagine synthase (glutamine-hydrolysing)